MKVLLVGSPVISSDSIQFEIFQYYPLSAELSVGTTEYPPTNVLWTVDGVAVANLKSCGFESLQILKSRSDTKYTNVLIIAENMTCTFAGEYVISVNTSYGETVISRAVNISKAFCSDNCVLSAVL